MTVLLIAFNALVFLYEVSLSIQERETLIAAYGIIPREVSAALPGFLLPWRWGDLVPVITAMFLHGGWMHIIGNMLFLWVFGDNVEDLMGPVRFLGMYLLAGGIGNLAHVVANPTSDIPTIGASGAVAGVLGAYLMNFPHARVVTLVPVFFVLTTVEIPALFFLLIWFFLQLANGFASLGVVAQGGVAWWAHVGGFVAGAVLVRFFRERRYLY